MSKWQCGVCGFIFEGENPPEKCPKCGAPKEKFEKISDDRSELIDRSHLTNMLHMKLGAVMDEAVSIADSGIKDNLDPGCVVVFKKAKEEAEIIIQMVKAEIQTHINKGKWG